MNSNILNLFETKLSIFTKHQYPSFSHIFDIILRKCCKQGLLKCHILCGLRMTKNANSASHFFVPIFLYYWMVLSTTLLEFFSWHINDFFDHFSSNIFWNLQMKDHDKKSKHAQKRKHLKHLMFFSQNVSCKKTQEFSAPIQYMFFLFLCHYSWILRVKAYSTQTYFQKTYHSNDSSRFLSFILFLL